MERRCGKKVIFFSEGRTSESTAKFFCIGRDIEYRELTLERNAENVWELVSDSRTQPELLGGRIVILLSELMRDRTEFIGTPTELSAQIDPAGAEGLTPNSFSHRIRKSVDALRRNGITVSFRKSNGDRLICLRTRRVSACEPLCARLEAGVACVPDEGIFSPHRASTAVAQKQQISRRNSCASSVSTA